MVTLGYNPPFQSTFEMPKSMNLIQQFTTKNSVSVLFESTSHKRSDYPGCGRTQRR